MDTETTAIVSEQKKLKDLIGSEGWGVARLKLAEMITDLQNAFNIEDKTPEEMVIDLKARKIATRVLWDFLQEIEGSAEAHASAPIIDKSYIVRTD